MDTASDINAALAVAKQLIQSGDYLAAEKRLVAIAEDSPADVELLYMLAVCRRYLHKYRSALETLDRLKQLVPEHGRAFQETGHVFRALNNLPAALNAYSRASQINPALVASIRAQIEILDGTERKDFASQLRRQLKTIESLPKPLIAVTDLIGQGKLGKAEQ